MQDYYSLTDLNPIKTGAKGLYMSPLDASMLGDDIALQLLTTFGNDVEITKFLPNLNLRDKDSIIKTIFGLVLKTENGLEFAYKIMFKNILAGIIFVNTPKLNQETIGFPFWTMDFFLLPIMRKNNIMTVCLGHMLYFLKHNIGVNDLYFIVDKNNNSCLSLLRKFPIDEVDNSGFRNPRNGTNFPRLFYCQLSTLNFR